MFRIPVEYSFFLLLLAATASLAYQNFAPNDPQVELWNYVIHTDQLSVAADIPIQPHGLV